MMSQASDNVSGADNQQERPETIGWVVGFVDGEGCFSIAIQRCRMVKLGWQVFPEFVVTQGAKSLAALETLQQFFGCGRIHINRRYDNHKENLYRYCVRAVADLRNRIVPFFSRASVEDGQATGLSALRPRAGSHAGSKASKPERIVGDCRRG